jgi:hypothetical protein
VSSKVGGAQKLDEAQRPRPSALVQLAGAVSTALASK